MEIRKVTQRNASFFAAVFVLLVGACSSPEKKSIPGAHGSEAGVSTETQPLSGAAPLPTATPVAEVYGPPEPAPVSTPEAYGPEPVQLRAVVLVLGPGKAHGFAHAGVLRALAEARVPIGAIYGSEMGALVGALYGTKETIHAFDWELQRFKDEVFQDQAGFLSGLIGGGRSAAGVGPKFEQLTAQVFAGRDLKDARIPIWIGAVEPPGGPSRYARSGSLARAVVSAAKAPSLDRPFPVEEAKSLGLGPVVVVDAAEDEPRIGTSDAEQRAGQEMALARKAGAAELRDADIILRPDLRGLGYLDYSKRSEIAFRGKQAAQERIAEIRRLVGLPENEGQ